MEFTSKMTRKERIRDNKKRSFLSTFLSRLTSPFNSQRKPKDECEGDTEDGPDDYRHEESEENAPHRQENADYYMHDNDDNHGDLFGCYDHNSSFNSNADDIKILGEEMGLLSQESLSELKQWPEQEINGSHLNSVIVISVSNYNEGHHVQRKQETSETNGRKINESSAEVGVQTAEGFSFALSGECRRYLGENVEESGERRKRMKFSDVEEGPVATVRIDLYGSEIYTD